MTTLGEEQDVATGTTKTDLEAQLAAARERELARARKLFVHMRPGDAPPADDELLELLLELEEEYGREMDRASGLSEGDRPAPIEIPPALAMVLEQMGQAQRDNTAAILELAKAQAANAPKPQETKLEGGVGDLAAALDGTMDDGGDGDDPLDEPVVFRSRGAEFKCIVVPRRRFTGPTGEQYFTNGVGMNFSPDGVYSTRNRRNVEALRRRPGMNREYWEVGKEPHSAPDPQLVVGRIFDLALALDDAGLEEIEMQERASHKREIVLKAVSAARLKVQGFAAPAEGE
jgi:hypothetical protein